MSRLYIVATPIGNLDDITVRALKVLESVSYVACEDTRRTGLLMSRLSLKAKLIRCDGHNADQCVPGILNLLEQGEEVAYASDAGTPGISDPGARLVEAARSAGYSVIPVPGVSAVATILSVAGGASRGWYFEGFLSNKSGKRMRRLSELLERGDPFVLYESPHRIVKVLAALADIEPEASLVIGREMTKVHEEYLSGSAADLASRAENGTLKAKGEFTILVLPSKSS